MNVPMSRHESEYRTPTSENEEAVSSAVLLATMMMFGVLVVLNGVLLYLASTHERWGKAGMAVVGGPVANVVLIVACLFCAPIVKRASGGKPITLFVILSIVLPILAAAFDFVVIGVMR
jgi:hypothetical protein